MNDITVDQYFAANNYTPAGLQKLITGHLIIKASINDSTGLFILDSGAGATVVNEKNSYKFKLQITIDSITGAGAGGTGLKVWSRKIINWLSVIFNWIRLKCRP